MPLFEDMKFLKATKYPVAKVGIIYLTENRRGGIIYAAERDQCYLYDMGKGKWKTVIPGSYLQCPGNWARHLNALEKRKFVSLMNILKFKNWTYKKVYK